MEALMARHPDRQQLTLWLDGASSEFDAHIDACEACASTLSEIGTQSTENLRPALLTLLRPPDDLHERVSERITARLQNRRDSDLFGSLLGIPLEAGRIFFDTETPDQPEPGGHGQD